MRLSSLVAGFLVVLAGVAVRADDATGIVRVRVTPPPDQAPSVATVSIRAQDDPNRQWSAAVTGAGTATFRGLPPATYQVTVDNTGGITLAADIRVDAREVVSIDATMLPAATGGSHLEVFNRSRAGEGTDFHERQLQDLPGANNLWALIDTAAPFLIADRIDNGGLAAARSALIGNRGASLTSTSLSFGDISVLNPDRLGQLPILPDLNAVDAVVLSSGLDPVEVASPGTAIGLALRRPGRETHGALQASFTTPPMVSDNSRPGTPLIARLDSWQDANVQVGGPLRDRVGAFTSESLTRSRQFDRDRPGRTTAVVGSLFAHVVAHPTDRNELRVVAALQRATHPYDGRQQFRSDDASERDLFWQSQVTWDAWAAGGNRRLISAGFQRAAFTPRLGAVDGGTIERVFDGVVPAAPSAVVSARGEVRFEFQPHDIRTGGMDHSLRTGATFGRAFSSMHVLAAPTVGELVSGLPARVWLNVAPSSASARHVLDLETYVADNIAVLPRLGVEVGLRADVSSGSAAGAAGAITWRTLAPRVAVRWNPVGPVTVFGGYSRYRPRLSLDLLAFGDPGEPGVFVYRWNDTHGNQAVDPNDVGVLVAQQGRSPGVASIDPKLRAPYTDELTLGAEQRLGTVMAFRETIVARREHALLGSVNTGVPLSSYGVVLVPDRGEDYLSPIGTRILTVYDRLPSSFGQDHFLLTNPAGGDALYDGLEIAGELTTTRWYATAGAMAYFTRALGGARGFGPLENDQGVVGELHENPNAAPFSTGSVFFDRSYVIKWSTSYRAAHDIRAAVTARYTDGQPFSRLVIVPNLGQGPEMIEAYRIGRTRFTFTLTIDARIEKGLIFGGHRAALRLDIFNLSNTAHEVEEDPVTGATFRRSTALQPPRTVRLGFRLEF